MNSNRDFFINNIKHTQETPLLHLMQGHALSHQTQQRLWVWFWNPLFMIMFLKNKFKNLECTDTYFCLLFFLQETYRNRTVPGNWTRKQWKDCHWISGPLTNLLPTKFLVKCHETLHLLRWNLKILCLYCIKLKMAKHKN